MWPRIAEWFGLEPAPFAGDGVPLEVQMADAGPVWTAMAARENLKEPELGKVVSFWHTDADLRRPFECITDMSKSRTLGFAHYQATDQAFFDLFERLRRERVIPQG